MRSKPREQVAKHPRRGPEGEEEGVRKVQCGYREHRGQRGLCGGAPRREPKEEDLQTLLGAPEPLCPRPRPGSVTILEARKEVTAYNAHTLQLTSGRGPTQDAWVQCLGGLPTALSPGFLWVWVSFLL